MISTCYTRYLCSLICSICWNMFVTPLAPSKFRTLILDCLKVLNNIAFTAFLNFICLSASSPMFHVCTKNQTSKTKFNILCKNKKGHDQTEGRWDEVFLLLQNCKENSIQNIILSVVFQKYFEGKYLNFSHQAIISSSFYDFYFYFQEFGGIHQVAEL